MLSEVYVTVTVDFLLAFVVLGSVDGMSSSFIYTLCMSVLSNGPFHRRNLKQRPARLSPVILLSHQPEKKKSRCRLVPARTIFES